MLLSYKNYFYKADSEYGERIAKGLGIEMIAV